MAKAIGENAAECKNCGYDQPFSAILLALTLHEISKDARQTSWGNKATIRLPGHEPVEVKFNPWAQGMRARKNFKAAMNEFRDFEKTELFPNLAVDVQTAIIEAYNSKMEEVSHNG